MTNDSKGSREPSTAGQIPAQQYQQPVQQPQGYPNPMQQPQGYPMQQPQGYPNPMQQPQGYPMQQPQGYPVQPMAPINIVVQNTANATNTAAGVGFVRVGNKSRTTAIILAFFLGWLGAHKFYLGETGMGVLYLLTGGFCGIMPLIDFIILLVTSERAFDMKYNAALVR